MASFPDISTFVGTETQLKLAIDHGATHLIFEDSKLSARSYTNDFKIPHFDKLIEWATLARDLNPHITLSFNLDILVHHRHFPLIKKLITSLQQAQIDTVRVQDQGMAIYLKELMPELKCQLATETGNQKLNSIGYYAPLFDRQILSNEMPYSELKKTIDSYPAHAFEIQVHGPLLIQYSNRRYMAGQEEEPESVIIKVAQDQQYPNRHYPFYDNEHGHFMFLYFDRCLLPYIQDLNSLSLSGWLIDGRGESEAYLTSALSAFRRYRDNPNLAFNAEDLTPLTETAQRPLKGGFFRANKTDQDRSTVVKDMPGHTFVGTVIHTESKKRFCVDLISPVKLGDSLRILTPEGIQTDFVIDSMEELGDSLTLFPWKKGIVTQSKLFIKHD